MSIVTTDLRQTRPSAREISYSPVSPLTAYTVQNAIEQTQAEIVILQGAVVANTLKPPAIVATPVNFAMSPYTVLATDYLIEVDTVGGAVTINLALAATRGNLEVEVKDVSGHATANNISVVAAGAETTDGLATYPIASDFGAYHFKPKTGGYTVI